MESRQRASPGQFAMLVEFMEKNGDLARPQQCAQGRMRAERLWQELTRSVNCIGGGVARNPDKWKKAWADWKAKTKKKASIIRTHASGTGGGPNSRQILTELEQRVLNVMGISAVTGQNNVEEHGFGQVSQLTSYHGQQPSQSPPQPEYAEVNTSRATAEFPLHSPALVMHDVMEPTEEGSALNIDLPILTYKVRYKAEEHEERPRSSTPPTAVLSASTTPRRRRQLLGSRQRLHQTPFERAAQEFTAIEQQRLRLEEMRDRKLHEREIEREKLLHEREMDWLRIESQRNEILSNLANVVQALANNLSLLQRQ